MTEYYIEIERPSGTIEYFNYYCYTLREAQIYALWKAVNYKGTIKTCREARRA